MAYYATIIQQSWRYFTEHEILSVNQCGKNEGGKYFSYYATCFYSTWKGLAFKWLLVNSKVAWENWMEELAPAGPKKAVERIFLITRRHRWRRCSSCHRQPTAISTLTNSRENWKFCIYVKGKINASGNGRCFFQHSE